jgi:hypothetical protein
MTPEAKKRKIGFLVEEKAVAYGCPIFGIVVCPLLPIA